MTTNTLTDTQIKRFGWTRLGRIYRDAKTDKTTKQRIIDEMRRCGYKMANLVAFKEEV